MSKHIILPGQTLWSIVKDTYGLTNNRDIANKVNEIAKANHTNPNSIFAGKSLSLPEKTSSSELSRGVQGVTINEETVKPTTSSLNDWTKECADSMLDVDQSGNPVFNKEVKPFDMAGDEFQDDIKNNGGAKAGEIYKQKALETARGEIALFDIDKDGAISPEEQVKGDVAAFEKKFGQLDPKDKSKTQEMSLRANLFMDLNKDKKVDDKEYAAFLYAVDANNKSGIANGKITAEEYMKTSSYVEQPLTTKAGAFKGQVRSCYKSLFGFDPKTETAPQ